MTLCNENAIRCKDLATKLRSQIVVEGEELEIVSIFKDKQKIRLRARFSNAQVVEASSGLAKTSWQDVKEALAGTIGSGKNLSMVLLRIADGEIFEYRAD